MSKVEAFFDQDTFTLSYIIYDSETKDAVIIDPVLDLNTRSWEFTTTSVDKLADFVESNGLTVHWVLDTHIHADHVTGMQALKTRFGAKLGISDQIAIVQQTFNGVFNSQDYVAEDGSQFDRLLSDGDIVEAGSVKIAVIHTPGHTPACLTYQTDQGIFTGDALFMPDIGVARCDFPRGSAKDLYHSIMQKLYTLPDETKVFVGHDYPPDNRDVCHQTTIRDSKARNVDLPSSMTEEDFVAYAENRDSRLPPPRLLFESIQININAGIMPPEESNGKRYLRMPLKV